MQMKTTTISHYTKSNTDDTAAGEDVERQELSFVAGGMQNGTAILEDWLAVSHKTTHGLMYKPEIVLLGIYPNL